MTDPTADLADSIARLAAERDEARAAIAAQAEVIRVQSRRLAELLEQRDRAWRDE